MSDVRCHEHRVAQILLAEVLQEHRVRRQVVGRHREEAVHLWRVQRHRDDLRRAGGSQHVGNQTRRNRDPGGILLVRSCIGEVGDHGADVFGSSTTSNIQHQQEFHQVVAAWWRERLDDEDLLAADAPSELYIVVIVGELGDRGRRELQAEVGGDGLC